MVTSGRDIPARVEVALVCLAEGSRGMVLLTTWKPQRELAEPFLELKRRKFKETRGQGGHITK